jgi:HK97 family phage prohead protease
MSGQIERRPAPGRTAGEVRVPAAWIERYGSVPADLIEREAYLVNAIEGGEPLRTGAQRTRDLLTEADARLAQSRDDDGLHERRAASSPVAARAAKAVGGRPGTTDVSGLALPWLGRSSWLGFIEQFASTAFDEQAAEGFADVLAYVAHDRRNALALIGTVQGGTMALECRRDGLHYSVELPATGIGPYVAEMVRRGDLRGASIGFVELDGNWTLTPERKPLRTVTRARLGEVSVVHRGAYPQATVAARSIPALTPTEFKRQVERREREQESLEREHGHRRASAPADAAPAAVRLVRVGDRYLPSGEPKRGDR